MKTLTFITGNKNKLREARQILKGFDLKARDVELPELQELNEELIVTDKVRRAMEVVDGDLFVEDSSLCFSALKGLPGPMVKWFEKTAGLQGMVEMISAYKDKTACAKSFIGYGRRTGEKVQITVFEGKVKGRIVEPSGKNGFGWDQIFVPDGHERTFAQMTAQEKNAISQRTKAFEEFRKHLEK